MIEPVIYTDVELESYIPSGWSLDPNDPPRWDERRHRFRFRVIDTSDLDWQLEVSREEIERLGRIEALRQAVDHLNRQRFKSIL